MALKTLTLTAAALGLGAALTGVAASKRAAAAVEDFPPLGEFVELDAGRVHYVRKGTGPEVVLIHGAGGNLREFTFDLMDRLSDRYTVTAFDRPGLGYTDPAPGSETSAFGREGASPVAQALMLREASETLGITSPVLVGHSYGGIVSMAWAVAALDSESPANPAAVVSLGGVLMPWPGGLGAYYTVNGHPFGGMITIPLISALVSDGYVKASVDNIFAPQDPPEGYLDYIGAPLTIRPASFRANVRQVNTLRPHVVEMSARYPDLTLPVEILHGTEDTIVPDAIHPAGFVPLVPSANWEKLEGVGHMPHHADPEATIAAIDRAATRAGLR